MHVFAQALNANANSDNALNLQQYFPQIKIVMWFDVAKPEPSAAGKVVDWSFSGDQNVSSAFVNFVTSQYAAGGAQYWVNSVTSCLDVCIPLPAKSIECCVLH